LKESILSILRCTSSGDQTTAGAFSTFGFRLRAELSFGVVEDGRIPAF
jgi:hypothetical protein